MTEPIRVVVADDHPLFREGVVAALQSADDIVVVGQASDADGAFHVVRDSREQHLGTGASARELE